MHNKAKLINFQRFLVKRWVHLIVSKPQTLISAPITPVTKDIFDWNKSKNNFLPGKSIAWIYEMVVREICFFFSEDVNVDYITIR